MVRIKVIGAGALAVFAVASPIRAQSPTSADCARMAAGTTDHSAMDPSMHARMMKDCAGSPPTSSGQAAFATIGEIVRQLKADPNTDWSTVNIEALRQHLIDMDDVVLRAVVAQRDVPGGVEIRATGTGRTAEAIKRIAMNHTRALDQEADYHAIATEVADGAEITVTAKNAADSRVVARIRGLGFAGLLTEGAHHAAHHLALARGDQMAHGHP